ncbi:hypothetical protein L6452_22783 [Arctium lappa]|uniref:Uncharacterized protein n=1 Tax=Arctium lappa TaxID=4217 RepID=A0ACB9B221_ARCLA|nr:hypothetical protein L6452_22783 [Arctium lappa]
MSNGTSKATWSSRIGQNDFVHDISSLVQNNGDKLVGKEDQGIIRNPKATIADRMGVDGHTWEWRRELRGGRESSEVEQMQENKTVTSPEIFSVHEEVKMEMENVDGGGKPQDNGSEDVDEGHNQTQICEDGGRSFVVGDEESEEDGDWGLNLGFFLKIASVHTGSVTLVEPVLPFCRS